MARHHLGGGFFGGWNPQRPDHRDHQFLPTVAAQNVPDMFELPGVVKSIPKINQGLQGSCTGHGTAGVVMYDQYKQGEKVVIPARAMIYYDARIPEGTTASDSGATVRDAVAGVVKYGVCPDDEFPYNDEVYNVAPSPQDYADATKQEALVYESVSWPHLNAALASGYPLVGGQTVYASMMTAQVAATGTVPFPGRGDQPIGGHCTWRFGYNSTDTAWRSPSGLTYPPRTRAYRNSWMNADGSWWGDQGNYFLPEKFDAEGLTSDFWVVRRIGVKA